MDRAPYPSSPYFSSVDGKPLPDPAQLPARYMERLLAEEFPPLFSRDQPVYVPSKDAKFVVVMSAPSDPGDHGDNAENTARIRFAADIFGRVWAGCGVNLTAATHPMHWPRLVLNGTTEQLPGMSRVALALGIPSELFCCIDCGPDGVGNTKTQFDVMTEHPQLGQASRLIMISSDYHGPRLARMAEGLYLPKTQIDLVLAPWATNPVDAVRLSGGEARRIIEYIAKGDLYPYPPSMLRQ